MQIKHKYILIHKSTTLQNVIGQNQNLPRRFKAHLSCNIFWLKEAERYMSALTGFSSFLSLSLTQISKLTQWGRKVVLQGEGQFNVIFTSLSRNHISNKPKSNVKVCDNSTLIQL
jgi:hypothetical protein